ncbi:MAG: peptidoglycan bridge formation glycyltransferase FemA/FemB family protein [Candidatus Saccharibacteria bacterium]
MMRLANTDELARWDELISSNPDGGNSLQSYVWGEFKAAFGWKPHRYIFEAEGREVAVQILSRTIPAYGDIWYSPKGPGVATAKGFAEILAQIKEAKPKIVFARFDPELLDDEVKKTDLAKAGLVRATKDSNSKSTIVIDLSVGEEAALASFSQSTRRNIRKSIVAEVKVEPVEASQANLDTMFELMKATEARAHYGLRPKEYFQTYWKAQVEAGQGQLFFTYHDGDVLSGIFVTYLGKRAWYKDGGSFELKRELQPTYLMQWEVMRWLMAKGITEYDMVGVPNRDQIGTGNSRDGLYEFKAKFNPDVTEYIGAWDLPLSAKYKVWNKLAERIAARQAAKKPEKFLY